MQISRGPGSSVAQIIEEFFSVANAYLEMALTHCSYVSNVASPSAMRFNGENPSTENHSYCDDRKSFCIWSL